MSIELLHQSSEQRIRIFGDARFPSLDLWTAVLAKWAHNTIAYSALTEGDNPHDYGERAGVSHLAHAVWMAGGVSSQEFREQKDGTPRGRCDLYVAFPSAEYFLEAKHIDVSVDRQQGVTTALERAKEDAENLDEDLDRMARALGAIYTKDPSSLPSTALSELPHALAAKSSTPLLYAELHGSLLEGKGKPDPGGHGWHLVSDLVILAHVGTGSPACLS